MKNAIVDILYFDGVKCERFGCGAEYKKLLDSLCGLRKKLKERLGEEENKILDEVCDVFAGMEGEACQTYFKYGVRFGARLMSDILSDD